MIQLGHMATGLLAGKQCSGPVSALLAGVVMHGMMDVAPHGEINDRRWEIASVAVGVPLLAATCGWTSPLTWGAIGGVLPDAEHVLPAAIKPDGALYPTHRVDVLHSSDTPLAAPAWLQVAVGGAALGFFAVRGLLRRRAGTATADADPADTGALSRTALRRILRT